MWLERRYAKQKHRDEADQAVIVAWQIMRVKVVTQNDKRLPPLKSLLTRDHVKQQPADLVVALHAIGGLYGLPVTVRRANAG